MLLEPSHSSRSYCIEWYCISLVRICVVEGGYGSWRYIYGDLVGFSDFAQVPWLTRRATSRNITQVSPLVLLLGLTSFFFSCYDTSIITCVHHPQTICYSTCGAISLTLWIKFWGSCCQECGSSRHFEAVSWPRSSPRHVLKEDPSEAQTSCTHMGRQDDFAHKGWRNSGILTRATRGLRQGKFREFVIAHNPS